jgi:hypothetical protein
MMLIRPDGTTTTYDVVASEESESDTLTLVDEFILFQEGANLIDHRWAFSPLETPGKKLKILSVQPASDARLQIVATDEYARILRCMGRHICCSAHRYDFASAADRRSLI